MNALRMFRDERQIRCGKTAMNGVEMNQSQSKWAYGVYDVLLGLLKRKSFSEISFRLPRSHSVCLWALCGLDRLSFSVSPFPLPVYPSLIVSISLSSYPHALFRFKTNPCVRMSLSRHCQKDWLWPALTSLQGADSFPRPRGREESLLVQPEYKNMPSP